MKSNKINQILFILALVVFGVLVIIQNNPFCSYNQALSNYSSINSLSDEVFPSIPTTHQYSVNYTSFLSFDNESALSPYMNATADGLTPETSIVISDLNITLSDTTFNCGINISNIHLYVQIQRCLIQTVGNSRTIGIYIQNCSNIRIMENEIIHVDFGLKMSHVSNIFISNNRFERTRIDTTQYGISNWNITISHNHFDYWPQYFNYYYGLDFENNTFMNSFGDTYPIKFSNCQDVLFNSNTLLSSPSGYWIIFENITKFQIYNTSITGCFDGVIYVKDSSNGEIANNTCINDEYVGINVQNSSQIYIHDNIIQNSFSGKYHSWDYRTNIEKWHLNLEEEDSWKTGIRFFDVSNSRIEKNQISYYKFGIVITDSYNNRISENSLYFNSIKAFYSDNYSENIFLNNYISEIHIWDIPLLFFIADSAFLIIDFLLYQKIQSYNSRNPIKPELLEQYKQKRPKRIIQLMHIGSYSWIMYFFFLFFFLILFGLGGYYVGISKTHLTKYFILFNLSFFIHAWIRYKFRTLVFKSNIILKKSVEEKNYPIQDGMDSSNRSILFIELFDLIAVGIAISLLILKIIEFRLILIHSLPKMRILYAEYITPFIFLIPLLSSGFWAIAEGSLFKYAKKRFKLLFQKKSVQLTINQK